VSDISIPLQDILTDPDHPTDLSILPEDEASALVRELYGFIPSPLDISITGGTVTISIPQVDDYRSTQALQTYKRAVRSAEQGKYQAAIRMFQDVLKVLPAHIDARRNLAMACMESGDGKAAKLHLVEVLRLKPDDAWAWLILANVYMQFDGDLTAADRFYQKAHELGPDDVFLLNNYGTLKAKQGHLDHARALFREAIKGDPSYPNPRYGLALSYEREGQPDRALVALEELFAQPQSQDPRSKPVYDEARALYVDVNRRIAQDSHTEIMERLREALEDHAARTGYPIDLEQDDTLSVKASTKLAWVYGRPRHIIKYRATEPVILTHLIAHEFEHIQLAYEARQAGRGKVFTSTDIVREYATDDSHGGKHRLQRKGFSDGLIADFMNRLTSGLANQLFNAPLDMVIEHRLRDRYHFIRPSQVVSLHATQLENLQALTDKSLRDMVPPRIYQGNIAMNCAYALFTDFLLAGATAYAVPYRQSRLFSTGHRLFEVWKNRMPDLRPGDEYDLVDEFATILDLQEWYEWRSENGGGKASDSSVLPGLEGPTNLELLRQKEPAVVMYLLGALQRFENMDDGEVLQVASEISLMGRFGLDYASSEQKYTLRSLPGESFSGLQLMCLMHVALKRVEPSADTGMPFDEAYATALSMHQSET